jgi:hypothetical protein
MKYQRRCGLSAQALTCLVLLWANAGAPAVAEVPDDDPPKAPVLIAVSISPEARVKASSATAARLLRQGEWTEFTVTVENAAGITAPLVIESQQCLTDDADHSRGRWLRIEWDGKKPLSGSMTETRRLRVWSRDQGVRSAVLNFNAGQGTQDLGFRSDVLLTFRISAPNPQR